MPKATRTSYKSDFSTSVGSTESMILSARAESIILLAPPAESMILSQHQLASVPSH
jgi:hypothetical protein